ncbi:hypothetical protein EV688_104163 [Chromatocurvus halotolerans]|uniref:Uncharacterized protein n=1 Tax=Chromatocurvus halotolerans TaxID=1132028 RepID=A0A4R2KZ41_9GAMM|nr:hypothetical protein EV688_104163 [Chromatocurvus halotolerans]
MALLLLAPPLAAQPVVPSWLRDVLEARGEAAGNREGRRDEQRHSDRRRQGEDDPDGVRDDAARSRALDWRAEPREPRLDARSAARRAQDAHGGRVLGVKRTGDSYRVRLLLDEGRVTTVTIRE